MKKSERLRTACIGWQRSFRDTLPRSFFLKDTGDQDCRRNGLNVFQVISGGSIILMSSKICRYDEDAYLISVPY